MEIIWPGGNLPMPFSPAIKVDGTSSLLFISATDARHAVQASPRVLSEARIPTDPAEQATVTMDALEAILKAGGATIQQVVQRVNYVKSTALDQWKEISDVVSVRYKEHKPTSTQLRVRRLIKPGLTWQLADLVAAVEGEPPGNVREVIHPKDQYREEPFSHCVKVGGTADLIYVSAISAKSRSDGRGSVDSQTQMVLENVHRILTEAGADLEDLVYLSVYLKNFADEEAVRLTLSNFLGRVKPAGKIAEGGMETDDLFVKIEAIAAIDGSRTKSRQDLEVVGRLAKGTRLSRGSAIIFLAGTVALPIVHTHPPQRDEGSLAIDLVSQAKKTFENIEIVLTHAEASFKDVFKLNRYMRDVRDSAKVDEVMSGFFADNSVAYNDVGVDGLVRENLLLEVSGLAMIP